jgi:transposase
MKVRISARKKYHVTLTEEEQKQLSQLIKKGITNARVITRARILLAAHEGKTDKEIYTAFKIADSTPGDIRERFCEAGLSRALYDLPHKGASRKLTGEQEAQVIAIACTDAPEGTDHWTLDLLVEEVKDKLGVTIGRTAIWKVLLRNKTKPWLKKNVVYTESNRRIYQEDAGCS